MAGRYRPRREFKFWLHMDVQEQSRLVEFIEYCKSKRAFARVVRDGIRLMWSLGEGDTTVLFELFPGLRAQLVQVQAAPPPDNSDLKHEISLLRKLMLEQKQLPPPPSGYPQSKPLASSMGAHKIALPIIGLDDDDQDTIVLNKSTGSTSNSHNLMAGIFGLE